MTQEMVKKQPVVVLVGHIDHGKSSILQKIKDFKITEKETGGITQHIGTYEVEHDGQKITFIDTPGHEAFSAMRARGAKVADIAVLVVAADDGVKPQTKEAISHVKKAQIPMIVALNKIDRPMAGPEKVKDDLAKQEVMVEDRGGDVPCIETSAKTGKGIQELLDIILLVADMQDLKADLSKPASGVVIETFLCSKRGCVVTLLLENGVLKKGDVIGTESAFGRVKRLEDFLGQEIKEARPGQGVRVLGFEDLPLMGQTFKVYPNLDEAKQNLKKEKEEEIGPVLDIEPEQKVLNLIIKTDVLGSIEPIKTVLQGLPQEKVVVRILKADTGDVNLNDLKLAETSKAKIIGFRVKTSKKILEIARTKKIKVFNLDLIYDLVEETRKLMKRIVEPERVRIDLGKLKTLLIFKTDKKRQIIGARVLEGEIKKNVKIEVIREDEKVGEGRVISLEKNKQELDKGTKGEEVGILFEGDVQVQENDILVPYEEKRQEAEL
jgi:translation initiation factor IF-2